MKLKDWIVRKCGGYTSQQLIDGCSTQFKIGHMAGEARCKISFAVLPLPFTEDQLHGRACGTFITPVGFASKFGECNVPAPGAYGYEQRAYYVGKDKLALQQDETDLLCHRIGKFDDAANSDALVPVIVTILR